MGHHATLRHARLASLAAVAALTAPAAFIATAAPASATPAACRSDQLKASWSDAGTARGASPTGRQESAVVQLSNSSEQACTLKGHPAVALIQGKQSEMLRDTAEPPAQTVTLNAGKSTTFTLLFLSEKDEPKQALTPRTVRLTPPGADGAMSLPWKWGPVTKQESATHPGNSVGPVGGSVTPAGGPDTKKVDCGSGWNNLTVQAVTSHGKQACPTAQKVAGAYGKAVQAKKSQPVTVTVNGVSWTCREEKGQPDPYQQCTNSKENAEKVRLLS